MFLIRLVLPIVLIAVILLVATAPRWSKWVAKMINRAESNLDEAGKNLKDIGRKE